MKPKQIAKAIAEELFVNGEGERADRLVLWVDGTQRNLGGWCPKAVADRIAAGITDALATLQQEKAALAAKLSEERRFKREFEESCRAEVAAVDAAMVSLRDELAAKTEYVWQVERERDALKIQIETMASLTGTSDSVMQAYAGAIEKSVSGARPKARPHTRQS